MCSAAGDGGKPRRIAPFGNPRIKVCLPLPEAYRSLPRPSSPDGAKASVVRPYTLSRRGRSKDWTNQRFEPPKAPSRAFRLPLGLRCILPRNVQLSKIKNPLIATRWWRQPGSNRRHPACKAGALPTELCPRISGHRPVYHFHGAWLGRGATGDGLCRVHLALHY